MADPSRGIGTAQQNSAAAPDGLVDGCCYGQPYHPHQAAFACPYVGGYANAYQVPQAPFPGQAAPGDYEAPPPAYPPYAPPLPPTAMYPPPPPPPAFWGNNAYASPPVVVLQNNAAPPPAQQLPQQYTQSQPPQQPPQQHPDWMAAALPPGSSENGQSRCLGRLLILECLFGAIGLAIFCTYARKSIGSGLTIFGGVYAGYFAILCILLARKQSSVPSKALLHLAAVATLAAGIVAGIVVYLVVTVVYRGTSSGVSKDLSTYSRFFYDVSKVSKGRGLGAAIASCVVVVLSFCITVQIGVVRSHRHKADI